IEKALRRYDGIYPTIYSGFVNLVAEQTGRPLKYINREDDSGDMGLRTSKEQYHPIVLAHKHLVHIGSPAAKTGDTFSLAAGDIILTEIRDTDKPEYLKLNTDIENNKFWGYDYREDPWLQFPIDENTFYDDYLHDKRAGDSINFAIRLSENGKMIGEAILWHFTYNGTAELGCRLFLEYQGKGYGKAAFKAVSEFAANSLKLKVWARCYRQNEASCRMITASGFTKKSEDETFFYFEQPSVVIA
ncbi:MAG: GNAT family N-acetyltransferase, partial [Clostridia bacterium]|nr:GNAT family N-acetyltransferase [Clostridia bacterium]